jgi:hypothetical protein
MPQNITPGEYMNKQTQKEAVFTAVKNVLSKEGITVGENTNVNPVMTRELRAQVNNVLFEGFKAGTIELDREFSDADLKSYISGLQSNWLRKDKRLNGGVSYIAKNPGSRAGSGDAQLKAMRTLLTTVESAEDKAEIQSHIDARLKEIQVTKVKSVSIDYSQLPADLASKFAK